MAPRLGARFGGLRRSFLPELAELRILDLRPRLACYYKKHGTASSHLSFNFGYQTSAYGFLWRLALVGLCGWRIWKGWVALGNRPPADIAFVLPAIVIFVVGYFVKTAPWDWDTSS